MPAPLCCRGRSARQAHRVVGHLLILFFHILPGCFVGPPLALVRCLLERHECHQDFHSFAQHLPIDLNADQIERDRVPHLGDGFILIHEIPPLGLLKSRSWATHSIRIVRRMSAHQTGGSYQPAKATRLVTPQCGTYPHRSTFLDRDYS